jgi:hypothetical protein
MPKPIPPPPPLPTPEETAEGLRFLALVVFVAACVFVLWAQLYHQEASMVSYGRTSSISWNIWKAENLDEQKYRGEESHRIIWMVGSSILRESFDEKAINAQLKKKKIPTRVVKFGFDRGASGLIYPLLRTLPIREGDIILHGVSPANFRTNWFKKVEVPSYRLMSLYTYNDFWDIEEWSLADKLEQSIVFPYSYWRFHEDFMAGLTEYWYAFTQIRSRKKAKAGYFLTFHRFKKKKKGRIKYGSKNFDFFPSEENDFSAEQFNIKGLKKMQEIAKEKGASLKLIDIEASEIYTRDVLNAELRDIWTEWKSQNDVWEIPSMPISEYYDLKHPNRVGRERINQIIFLWISNAQL